MMGLLPRLPAYLTFRRFGRPRPLPFNLVVSVTYRCNSRCKTCNVWKRSADELTTEEWEKLIPPEEENKDPFSPSRMDGAYKNPKTGEYTMRPALKCVSCGK